MHGVNRRNGNVFGEGYVQYRSARCTIFSAGYGRAVDKSLLSAVSLARWVDSWQRRRSSYGRPEANLARGGTPRDEAARRFVEANERLSRMYGDFVAMMTRAVPSPRNASYLDFACNAGYFCYTMADAGFLQVHGVDAGDYQPSFDFVRAVTGLSPQFHHARYNMMIHKLDGFTLDPSGYDVVSCIAFLCHSSDPHFLLDYLISKARRAILIYTRVHSDTTYSIRFGNARSRYFGQKFPICFDSATSVSDSLMKLAMTSAGFEVTEIPYQPYWVLTDEWRCFIGRR